MHVIIADPSLSQRAIRLSITNKCSVDLWPGFVANWNFVIFSKSLYHYPTDIPLVAFVHIKQFYTQYSPSAWDMGFVSVTTWSISYHRNANNINISAHQGPWVRCIAPAKQLPSRYLSLSWKYRTPTDRALQVSSGATNIGCWAIVYLQKESE